MKIVLREDGVATVKKYNALFTVFIPSRKREQTVIKNPLFRIANVCVHKDEVSSYADYFKKMGVKPGALLGHDRKGLPGIRNWMIERFEADEMFQVQADDDMQGLRFSYTRKVKDIRDEEGLIRVLVHEAIAASDIPTGLFMFQQSPRPQERSSLQPFILRRWGRTDCFGMIDADLRFDENLLDCEDMDISLQCISKYGVLWMDMRYFVLCETIQGGLMTGGSAGVSTLDTIRRSYEYLARKWGHSVIKVGEGKKRGQGYEVSVAIPQNYHDVMKMTK